MTNPNPTHKLFSSSASETPGGGVGTIRRVEAKAVIVDGTLIPDSDGIREMVGKLRADLRSDPDLNARFNADPRRVMAERGFARDLQTEIIAEAAAADCGFTCASTSSCCCETL